MQGERALVGAAKSTIAGALSALFFAACGGNVKSTKDTGDRSPDSSPTVEPSAADWTMLGYDLASSYWNKRETKVSTSSARALVKAWEFDTGSDVTGTPVISGGRVYVASQVTDGSKGGVVAIDLTTGAVIWRNTSMGGTASLALDRGVLYQHGAAGVVRALNADDGQVLWEYKTDEHPNLVGFSSPIVIRDFVLVGGASIEEVAIPPGSHATFRGFVLALNKRDGSLAWKKYTVEPPYNGAAIWSTLSADEAAGMVVAATGNNYTGQASDTSDAFLALPLAAGGDFLWKRQIRAGNVYSITQTNGDIEADFGANPILFEVQGSKLAAGGNKGGDVWVLDRSDGSLIAQRNVDPGSSFKGGVFNSGAWDGKHLLFVVNGATSTGPGSEAISVSPATLFAFDPLTLDIDWERQIDGPAYSPISVANGVGFFGKNTTLQAFDTATGKVLMEFPTSGTICSAPAVSNGYVVFGSGMSWVQAIAGTHYYALKVP